LVLKNQVIWCKRKNVIGHEPFLKLFPVDQSHGESCNFGGASTGRSGIGISSIGGAASSGRFSGTDQASDQLPSVFPVACP
jgi:hypothetical protein